MMITETWVNHSKRRYYKFGVYKDLLGDLVLFRDWGSLDSKMGGTKIQLIKDITEGQEIIERIIKRRKQHDYNLVESIGLNS